MKPGGLLRAACVACALLAPSLNAQTQTSQEDSAYAWLDDIARQLQHARTLAGDGSFTEARSVVVRAYLDGFEPIEGHYGPGAKLGVPSLAAEVQNGERAFHALMQSADAPSLITAASAVEAQLEVIRNALRQSGVSTTPRLAMVASTSRQVVPPSAAATPEIKALLQQFSDAASIYRAGDAARARALVENAYLEGFEPMEARLPSGMVDEIERAIHLQLRPAMSRGASPEAVTSMIGALGDDLVRADGFLLDGGTRWFASVSAFAIIVREGLEAVLLVAALLAYLTAIGAAAKHRRQIFAGVAGGIGASVGTWFLARTLLPISGANRELIEGITALVAVVVLLYVAHWLFQKTYIHDWKDYLRTHAGDAVTRGSSAAMALLAFAAVYREGFETVLFYQALSFDAGAAAILAGFIPGALLIIAVGFAIIRAGVKLPLKKVFAWTNALLLYLAFVFIGKGLYNLQEAGVFSPHPLPLPDHPALRQLLGFYPLIETIAAQLVFAVALALTFAMAKRRARARQSAPLPVQPGVARPA